MEKKLILWRKLGFNVHLKKGKYMIEATLEELGLTQVSQGGSSGEKWLGLGETISSISPVDGKLIGTVSTVTVEEYDLITDQALEAFYAFRKIPAPKRGEMVRQLGDALREKKEALGQLVSYEMGKSLQEGLGEVQEMIDICDFAVGLSRQLHGFTMHSERPFHRMYDQYHPLGVVGIISAFNFPVAVWSWNTALAWICGNVTLWKPSEKTPFCAIACQKIAADVFLTNGLPNGISNLVIGNAEVGKWMAADHRIPLLSATGSTRMGKSVAQTVAARLGKSLLELGGNNAIIVTPSANIKTTIIGTVFGAVGTAGQRCTSTRRLIVHEAIYNDIKKGLKQAYSQLKIGNPLEANNHIGPLIDVSAVDQYLSAQAAVEKENGTWVIKGEKLSGAAYESGCYVSPSIVEISPDAQIVQTETFAPLLYLIKYSGSVENAIAIQNEVKQGLSSAIITQDIQESETFLSHWGSDCGIANVNIGTSGAEIGGAFGGEKETGGGRESGSDAWKVYMRRQTNTINFSDELPLAQGINFDL